MNTTPATEGHSASCPVVHGDYTQDRPAFWYYNNLDRLREESPTYWNTFGQGFWMVTRYDDIRQAFQSPNVFQTGPANPFHEDRGTLLLPQDLNGPGHVKYRQVLNPWFSPGSVKKLEPVARARCRRAVDALVDKGGCDFVSGFAITYPTEVFLASLGLPVEDGEQFRIWTETLFASFFGRDAGDAEAAKNAVLDYFEQATTDREARSRDPETDFVEYLLRATIDGVPLTRDEIRTICLTLMLAGLDTTRSQLGYMFHHLATHDEDRRHLLATPELYSSAVDEFCRLYPLILTSGRIVAEDIDFHGCPMKKGDIVWLGISSANRDPRKFENPQEFAPDRQPNPHLGFAAGVHHCLGAHLARMQLVVALEEWHRRIPDYRLATDEPLTERGGQLTLLSLPLAWNT